LPADTTDTLEAQLTGLLEQNRQLQQQLQDQQKQIDELRRRLDVLHKTGAQGATAAPAPENAGPSAPDIPIRFAPEKQVVISGEAGLGFFHSGPDGQYPNSDFRVDEAKLFLEAPVGSRAYVFSEFDLTLRESSDETFHLGQFYVDLENLAGPWAQDRLLNLRLGRFDIPFGEEYQTRNVIDNPLISHSLGDLWGVDEGASLYGSIGRLQYVVAVQNGGVKTLHDYNSDKTVVARIGGNPAPWLHLSASAMRTGRLNVPGDSMSALWFGNGFFRSIGTPATKTFNARLFEVDAGSRWRGGHLKAAGGYAWYDDDDPAADNRRELRYFSLEGMQTVTGGFYGAARYSRILTDQGYPLVGQGNFGEYFFGSPLTRDLWRLSLAVGYRFNPDLLFKIEYSLENGRLVNGESRDGENVLAAETGLKF
ncbi:MAG: hypothetical protein WC485_12455, partial [Opitutaceae bacterium]